MISIVQADTKYFCWARNWRQQLHPAERTQLLGSERRPLCGEDSALACCDEFQRTSKSQVSERKHSFILQNSCRRAAIFRKADETHVTFCRWQGPLLRCNRTPAV